jgi:hypothetical protein
MKKYLFILLVATACSPKMINTATTTTRDSLAVKIVHHRDTIRVPGDSVVVIKTIHDTVSFTIEKKVGRSDIIITNKHGQLSGKCECDSIQRAYDILQKDTTRYKFKETKITRTVYQQVTNKFDRFCRWFFIVVVAMVSLYAGLKLKGKLPIPF